MTDRGTLKVLVAEDEPAMLSLVARHLRRLGFSVTEASDGDSAWDLAQQVLPDLVLLDVMMPGMSGWEVCKRLKGDGIESAPFRRTGVVMLTGIGDNLNEMTSPLFEADAWLNKPFYFPDLERKIRETLGKHGRPMPIADLEDDEEAAAEEEATLLGGDDGDDGDDDDDDDDGDDDDDDVSDEDRGGAVRRAGRAIADKVKKAVSSAVAKVTGRGAAAKKATTKKAAKKKAPARKAPAKKAAKKKAPARKAPAKKAAKNAAKNAAKKKAPARKAPAKKAAKKKAPVRKAPAKKATAGNATKKRATRR